MKKARIYPAVFQQDGEYVLVTFPDLAGCHTQAKDMYEAYRYAKEVLSLYLDGRADVPVASALAAVSVPKNGYVMLVEEDTTDDIVYYKKEEIPQLISDKLRQHGYTKYKVAKILDVSESYVNLVAQGKRRPSPEMAKRIATLLDFDWQVFFG